MFEPEKLAVFHLVPLCLGFLNKRLVLSLERFCLCFGVRLDLSLVLIWLIFLGEHDELHLCLGARPYALYAEWRLGVFRSVSNEVLCSSCFVGLKLYGFLHPTNKELGFHRFWCLRTMSQTALCPARASSRVWYRLKSPSIFASLLNFCFLPANSCS